VFLKKTIVRTPDIYIDEIQSKLWEKRRLRVSISTIWQAIGRCGFTRKKLSAAAMERNEMKRSHFLFDIGEFDPKQLVFVDKSACNKRTTHRGYGWAIKGERCKKLQCFVRGKRYSILPALSLSGFLHVKVREGSFTTSSFEEFIDDLLDEMQPYPGPNSVIVMDNCRIHKAPSIIQMIEERGMRVMFLPPYSPDFNPIELAFSFIKTHIRRFGPELQAAMDEKDDAQVSSLLIEAVFSVPLDDIYQFFGKCGYI